MTSTSLGGIFRQLQAATSRESLEDYPSSLKESLLFDPYALYFSSCSCLLQNDVKRIKNEIIGGQFAGMPSKTNPKLGGQFAGMTF